jgi:hypothetical protein
MISYLEKLRARDEEKRLGNQLTKPTEPPFDSFGGDQGRRISGEHLVLTDFPVAFDRRKAA